MVKYKGTQVRSCTQFLFGKENLIKKAQVTRSRTRFLTGEYSKKRAQVTIFIIVALIIVVGVTVYFLFRGTGSNPNVPTEIQGVYDYYLSCLEDTLSQGIDLLGEQGGYIETPEFERGSAYAPLSSQLDFFGQGVPYWMYVSGNNILKEQVPTKDQMKIQLEKYIEERVAFCDFSNYELQGFDVFIGNSPKANVLIRDENVELSINNKLTIFKGNVSSVLDDHEITLNSKIGKFYDIARNVYDFEKEESFLEKYSLDVMRLYAPVDGSEISCVPKVFVDEEIRKDIIDGLSSNIPSLKLEGNYYDLKDNEREYFISDAGFSLDENVNFMYFSDWSTRIEIYGDKVVEPVGLQEGLSALGFCYVPYHLVYDIQFPVMIQIYDEENFFQFPVGVIINKNQERQALPTVSGISLEEEICEFSNKDVKVSTYDVDLKPVEALISFECLGSTCNIGETKIDGNGAILKSSMPRCVNGFVTARAEGYADSEYQISTNEVDSIDIILNKKYNVSLDLGEVNATVNFDSSDYSTTVIYPDMNSVELVEGYYNVTVYVYDSSSLVFSAIKNRKCVDVPESGIGGILGLETEKCFDINIPETKIDFVIVGGGKSQEYITLEQLSNSNKLNIAFTSFGLPSNLDELQSNHIKVEDERLVINFE